MLGRQATSSTELLYDEEGRVARIVTTHEPRWLEEDLAWARAYLQWQAGRCPACRLDLADTTAMEGGEPAHSYAVPPPGRCHACDARIKAQEEHAKKGSQRPEALVWMVEQVS